VRLQENGQLLVIQSWDFHVLDEELLELLLRHCQHVARMLFAVIIEILSEQHIEEHVQVIRPGLSKFVNNA
jgi:hypothetical protein